MGLGKGYCYLETLWKDLAMFVSERLSCEMIDISQEEIEAWEQKQAEILRDHPEISEILSYINSNMVDL